MSSTAQELPRLVFFYSGVSGRCRRVEGFLAQVLQRRHNHETFKLHRVEKADHPELFERFDVTEVPTLAVVEGKTLCSRLVAPKSCREIERFLAPWLR
jgi:thioredoxin-like negative regulator of GroEL